MVGLIAKVAETLVAACLFAALTLVHTLPRSPADVWQIIRDAAHMSSAPRHIVKEHQRRRLIICMAIECPIQIVPPDAQDFACTFQKGIQG